MAARRVRKNPLPVLVLSGERKDRRLIAHVNGKPVALSYGQFRILVRLILARGQSENGFVSDPHALYPEAVRRLRKTLDQAGPTMGKTLIQTGAGSEYGLGIHLQNVRVKKSCQELPATRVLSSGELKELHKVVQVV